MVPKISNLYNILISDFNKPKYYLLFKILLLTGLCFISTKLTYKSLINSAIQRGPFFLTVSHNLDVTITTKAHNLWNMPLSNILYLPFHTLSIDYFFAYIMILYLFFYLANLFIIRSLTNSKIVFTVFIFLILHYIYLFRDIIDVENLVFSVYVTSIIYLLYKKEKEEKTLNYIMLSLTLGVSFNVRSTLLLLPLLVGLKDLISGKKIKKILILLLLPYSLLFVKLLLSYKINGSIGLTELKRAKLNIISGIHAVTNTIESNESILKKVLLSTKATTNLVDYLSSFIKRLRFVIEIFNIHILLSILIILIKIRKDKFYSSSFFVLIYLIFLHSLFSIEKRYLFPISNIFAVINSTFFITSRSEDRNKTYFTLITIIGAPFIITLTLVLKYFLTKDYLLQNYKTNSVNLILAIDNLYRLNNSEAFNYLNRYLARKEKYLYTDNIEELLKLINRKELIKDYQAKFNDDLFNNYFVYFLTLLKSNENEKAANFLKENWKSISNSYVRNPTNKNEIVINEMLGDYIKENDILILSFSLISKNKKEFIDLCEKTNTIIKKINKKHQFKCNMYVTNNGIVFIDEEKMRYEEYILFNCIDNKRAQELSKIINSIIKLEKKGEYNKALSLIEKNISKHQNYKLYVEKGNIQYFNSDFTNALKSFSKALELCPCAKDALFGKKEILRMLNKSEEISKLEKEIREKCKDIKDYYGEQ